VKALVYTNPYEMTYREEPEPVACAGEAIVRVESVGICGSDMHGYHGHDARRVPPLILGHEAVGRVVSGTRAGQRVILNPLITCGHCEYCQGGRANLCPERKLIGMNRPGAFAELISIPEPNLINVPEDMEAYKAALTEPAATALHALHMASRALARPISEARSLVLGGGSIGLLSALFLKSAGCRHVTLGETNALRRQTAQGAGIDEVYDPLSDSPKEGGFDLVMDAVGGAATRKAALRAIKPGGVVMHIGLMDSKGEMDVRKLTLSEVTFIGTYTYTYNDLVAAMQALYEGALGDLSWVEQRSLAEGAAAFAALDAGHTAAAKVILNPA
jgi:2-desacetyl-2-hydroxyethyl bacteriochlorophyllide A dehydrogenase